MESLSDQNETNESQPLVPSELTVESGEYQLTAAEKEAALQRAYTLREYMENNRRLPTVHEDSQKQA